MDSEFEPIQSATPASDPVLPPPLLPAPVPPTPRPPRRGPGWFGVVLVAGATSLVVGSVAGLGGYLVGQQVDAPSSSASAGALPQVSADQTVPTSQVSKIVAEVLPSVVSILAEGKQASGSGSGFVLRDDGYVLTNNHVVELADTTGGLTVVFNDGTKVAGKIVGTNTSYDLAVVKVNRTGLKPVVLGDSEAVVVGDSVIAIGAPLGLEGTVTSGIVSALDRPVTTEGESNQSFINAIQTDAAINPGNSGGPLLDAAGHVIGINSAIASVGVTGSEAGNIGLGFAIPVNSAKRIAEELIATGTSTTPAIGVSVDTSYDGDGAKISEVNANGAAQDAGLHVGDIIHKLDGRIIDDSTELVVAIRSHAPGDKVDVEFERGGRTQRTVVTLGALAHEN